MLQKILRLVGISKPDTRPIETPKPLSSVNDYDPQWVWDIYGTGIRPPEKPLWLDGWERTVVRLDQPEVELIAPLYDELEKYLDDMDKHRGKERELPHLPRYIAIWGQYGHIKVIRTSL